MDVYELVHAADDIWLVQVSQLDGAEGLAPALEKAFRDGGVQLVVAPIDYSENTRVLIDELRRAAPKRE